MICLKPEGAEEYIRLHLMVWPGVTQMISACNIRNYSIFVKAFHLFAYFEYEGNDFDSDMAKMTSDPETQLWWSVVKPLMDPIESREAGEFWGNMEEIFYLS